MVWNCAWNAKGRGYIWNYQCAYFSFYPQKFRANGKRKSFSGRPLLPLTSFGNSLAATARAFGRLTRPRKSFSCCLRREKQKIDSKFPPFFSLRLIADRLNQLIQQQQCRGSATSAPSSTPQVADISQAWCIWPFVFSEWITRVGNPRGRSDNSLTNSNSCVLRWVRLSARIWWCGDGFIPHREPSVSRPTCPF